MASIACQHHISWVVEVDPGIHQCIQCFERVDKKQITPKFETLSTELQRDWDDFEAGKHPAAPYPH
ncbi:MAG TPA: hypothetical protein VLT47_11770 [Anaeromyxobacteraceae bacterium]|nr:hypothetical protein [Anaeromyxobacteraceae bacterium]